MYVQSLPTQYTMHVVKSPPSKIDRTYGELVGSGKAAFKAALPPTVDWTWTLYEPRDQGNRGTCAAFAACAIRESQECVDSGDKGYLSPEFIYYYRSNKPTNKSMNGREVMDVLTTRGVCTEASCPYRDDEYQSEITITQEREAAQYKGKTPAIIQTEWELKHALVTEGPCWASFPSYSNNWPTFWKPKNQGDKGGGHAVAVVGYNSEGFILRNSHGPEWNGNGHVVWPYADFDAHWEIWTIVDIKGSPKLNPLPGPSTSNSKGCCNMM